MIVFKVLLLMLALTEPTKAIKKLAPTPPMGWISSGLQSSCDNECVADSKNIQCMSADLVSNMVFQMVTTGYYASGYNHIILAKCWQSKYRTLKGEIQAHKGRFPNGMNGVTDFVHLHGFKLGLYFSREDNPQCSNVYKNINELHRDLDTLISWHVDYVLFDVCYIGLRNFMNTYQDITNYLENNSTRPITIECNWPIFAEVIRMKIDYAKIREICHVWSTMNITDNSWSNMQLIFSHLGGMQSKYKNAIGPGSWFLPNRLLGYDNGLKYQQLTAQMIMFAIYPGPLFIQDNLLNVPTHISSIYNRPAIIQINQDSLARRGLLVFSNKDIEIWTRALSGGKRGYYRYAIAVVNKSASKVAMVKTFQELLMGGESYAIKLIASTDLSYGFSLSSRNPAIYLNFSITPSTVALIEAMPQELF